MPHYSKPGRRAKAGSLSGLVAAVLTPLSVSLLGVDPSPEVIAHLTGLLSTGAYFLVARLTRE
jgi:hypothetical protein